MDRIPEPEQVLDSQRRRRDKLPVHFKIVIVIIAGLLFYIALVSLIVVLPPKEPQHPPTGSWNYKTIEQEVKVEFGRVTPSQKPVDIELILFRNLTAWGRYKFTSNDDGVLALVGGENVGTLTYSDLADNERIDIGDLIELTNLAPGSHYELIMIWAPDGSRISSTTFATPTG